MPDGPPVRASGCPTQTGPPFVAVGVGSALTTTVVVASALLVQPLEFVTVSEYTPAIDKVALEDTVGFCTLDVNPLGPVHE
jgi:tartrate dehydratase alpha subunit/fumarate hydratase class I-like protein